MESRSVSSRNSLIANQAADIESVIQLTVELAPKLAEYETVLFVDASVLLRPGQWVLEKLDDSTKFESCIGHHFCPQELLNLAATLYDANPRAYMLSIGAKQFDHAESLSEEVTAQLGAGCYDNSRVASQTIDNY
jgi:Ni,Fe-hydrogenase maturation factor